MYRQTATATLTLLLSGCFFGDNEIKDTCDEPQSYQAERLGPRIESPEDLDTLDRLKEMPIPEAQTPPRPEGSRCITTPPSIRTE